MKRPYCERAGTKPHPATKVVAWCLRSGRVWKFSCDEHCETFGGPNYLVADLRGFVDNCSNDQPVHPLNSPLEASA